MGTIFFKFIMGAVAGLFAWMIMEPSAPNPSSDAWPIWELRLIFLFGLFVGGSVGLLDGFSRGGKLHAGRGLGLGALFGAVGACIGHSVGGAIAFTIFGTSVFTTGAFLTQVLARIVAFVPIGLLVGAAIGAASLNPKKAIQGAIGGGIGGAISGLLFDVLGATLAPAMLAAKGQHAGEVGGPSRALTFVLLGAAIALFIGLVERLARSAWLRLSLGRNEGKEWSLDTAETMIGRSERAHVPLFGDTNVAPVHAVIRKQQGQYFLFDAGTPVGTAVNGQRVSQALLMPGAVIQIGSFALTFLMKNMPAPHRAAEAYVGQAYQPYAQPSPVAAAPAMPVASMQPTQAFTPHPQASQPTMMQASMGAMMGFTIVAIDGPLLGRRFPVQGVIEVGRESAQVPVSFDTAASRRHASIAPDSMGVQVTDLNSTNGTFVNGQRVSQAVAKPGDTVKIGSTSFRVEAG